MFLKAIASTLLPLGMALLQLVNSLNYLIFILVEDGVEVVVRREDNNCHFCTCFHGLWATVVSSYHSECVRNVLRGREKLSKGCFRGILIIRVSLERGSTVLYKPLRPL